MRSLHLLLGFLVLVGLPRPASPATITIDAEKDLVPVNPLLFGTNLHANDESGEPIKAFIRDIGLTLYRYPDGGGYYYLDRPGDGWGSGKAGLGANDKLAASYLGCFKNVARFAGETGCRLTVLSLADRPIKPCVACRGCFASETIRCVQEDPAFEGILDKFAEADGILIGSPVYFGSATPQIMALLDRVGYVARKHPQLLRRKVGAAIVVARRAGQQRFQELFNYATVGFYWRWYEPQRGKPNYDYTDKVVAWCQDHEIRMKGHPLLWGDQAGVPTWSQGQPSPEVQRQRVTEILSRLFRSSGDAGHYVVGPVRPGLVAVGRRDAPG